MHTPEPSDSLPAGAIEELTRNLLACYLESHGEECRQRFEQDDEFRGLLWDQSIHTLGLVAALMSCLDESIATQGIAAHTIARAKLDLPEVAALRVFTLENMRPKEATERAEISARFHWFLREYQRARGERLAFPGH